MPKRSILILALGFAIFTTACGEDEQAAVRGTTSTTSSTMPDLRGMTVEEATAFIDKLGVEEVFIKLESEVTNKPRGIVVAQEPVPGATITEETLVFVWVPRAKPMPSQSAEPSPSPSREPQTKDERNLDEAAILSMLKEYLQLYNAGDYIGATSYLSSSVEKDCGGPTDLAFALSQNHRIERIDYDVADVKAWGPKDPDMADVVTIERYGGRSHRLTLGLRFDFQQGRWKLGDLYPIGAGAFC